MFAGPLIALMGLRYFHLVAAGITALFVMIICFYTGMSAGWMSSIGGSIAVVLVAINLGLIAGCIVKRYIWLMVGMLGLVAGFFAGATIFSIIYACVGWSAIWGFWVIAITLAAIGTWASCTMG